MIRLITVLFFAMFASMANANDFEDADKGWSQGKPWPAHWGVVQYPYKDGWNVVMLAFVNKIYPRDAATSTWLKNIPYAMDEGATVEICMGKRGVFELSSLCQPALVDPEVKGKLKEGDVIAFFYPNHGTGRFSKGPGSDARQTLRVFQKISDANDSSCWERDMLVIKIPKADTCFKRVDAAGVERILSRDFGPRSGGVNETVGTKEQSVLPTVTDDVKAETEQILTTVNMPVEGS